MANKVRHYDGNQKFKDYSHATGSSGTHWIAGQYTAPVTDSNLTQASLTQALGTADVGYGSHAFVVMAAVGVTDGTDLVLTVTGTSITDAGVRTPADSEVVVADGTAVATDEYYETVKKWIGPVTYTLSSSGGTAFNLDFNYGFAKYEDLFNTDFTCESIEVVTEAGANDASYDVILYKHGSNGNTDWTYHATAFAAGGEILAQMTTDFVTETELSNGEMHAWKHDNLNEFINSDSHEGLVIKIITGAANSIEGSGIHIGYIQ